MKIAVVFKSKSGNTEVIAESIKTVLEAEPGVEIVCFGGPEEAAGVDADLYIAGSWTDKGNCVNDMAEFMKSVKNKKIAFFGTAGFAGEGYFESLYQRAKASADDSNEFVGHFYCQGKMPMAVRERYIAMIKENPEDEKLQVSLANFDAALSHPDEKDKANAAEWAKGLIQGK